ncbi:MAG: hypothetical protein L0H73_09630, partial [Nitrococcus sp.]|nr:hypothetical protein [Nitrococcus sp.]
MLSPEDFPAFFEEIYGHEPFPWQRRLLSQVAVRGEWPSVLDLPTGSGKTSNSNFDPQPTGAAGQML